ncbi:efflux RND transporter permease subunit [Acuticoccus sp. I52.16.1]|uniref:efflux RND transporter permease subunit n=1 Tax=Acuticoccus sp. I52.16.1 TaxID=2928472 RepID=UPI001FD314C8|nr:efflux RND transporter permease subunit [Acuticoccus sp. I52.16.1]UOM34847.1 efflux RND transporter permease subunit [Acuticoccus sp. I52.16.1]
MISILDGLLNRPRTILTLLIFLLGAGAFIYATIPKEANPDIDVPIFYVSVVQQGISPEDANRLLVKPMETELRGLDGLKEIKATASEGHAGIILEFNADFDKDEALADVRDKVDRAQAELPDDAEEPTITETNFSLVPTIIVALSGDVPERTLYQHARRLKDAVEAIPTVLSASLSGSREEQLEVLIDRTAMESYQVQPVELLQALQNNNALVPAGFLDTGEGRFSVKVPGLIEDAEDVYNMVIKSQAGGIVTVGDIAEVRRSFKDPTTFTRVNGRPAITIDVVKRLGENIIENNQAVKDVVEKATASWPGAIKVDYLLDQSSFIYEVLGGLEASISTAIVLVMIVIVAALGFRSALLVGIAIPTSILLGFAVLAGLGMTVNMMVMFGLVLCVGLLVDGAIVVVEYADRRIAEGADRPQAFREAAHLMVWPLISSTATTLIAFLPMLLWPGVAGEFMSYLPVMVIIVLTVALVTAMVFLPVVGAILSNALIVGLFAGIVVAAVAMMALAAAPMPLAVLAALAGFVLATTIATRLAGRWGRGRAKPPVASAHGPFDITKLTGAGRLYVSGLRLLAGNTLGIILTVVVVSGMAFAVMQVFAANSNGVEFFVEEEPDVAVAMISARGNMSAREALGLVREVEKVVLGVDGVDNVVTNAFPSGGDTGGGAKIDGVQDKPADIIGQLQIELVDYCCRRPAAAIFEDIRNQTDFAGIKVEVRKIEGGPPTGKDIQLQITSELYDDVVAATARVRDHVETVEGLRDVEDDRPLPGIEWQLDVDREEAGRFGADVTTVGQIIQLVTNGVLLTQYQPDDSEDQIDIRVRYPEAERTLQQFGDLRLKTDNGQVPIINFIDVNPQQRVSSIQRVDGQFAMTVKADVLDQLGYDLNAKIAEIDQWVKSESWPQGVTFSFRGANEDQAEAMSFLMQAMIASLVMMFLVLVTQFNSFYQTALTLLTIVLSAFGVLLGMAITGQKFSVIMTGTGIIALAGIVVNNAIVLIDTFNRERLEQPDLLTATLATAAQRVRPILLTTITTIAGLIPMATQVNLDFFTRTIAVGGITSIWWVQLSTAIIAGLAFSTILTLVVIPVMLAMPETVSRTAARLRGRGVAPMPAGGAPLAEVEPAEPQVYRLPAAPPEPRPAPGTPDEALPPDVYAPVVARARSGSRDVAAETPSAEPATAAPPETGGRTGTDDGRDTEDGHTSGTAEAADTPAPDVYAPVLARQHRRGEERDGTTTSPRHSSEAAE